MSEERRSKNLAQVEQWSKDRMMRIESSIDRAISEAIEVYETCKRQADPYAMHKAIESLSLVVLVTFANKRAEEMIDAIDSMRKNVRQSSAEFDAMTGKPFAEDLGIEDTP